jgi:hypothetical protein
LFARHLLYPCLMAILCASAHAQWYVDLGNTSGVDDGTSWATAFTAVQPAVDAAFNEVSVNTAELGADVWVAEGVYDDVGVSEPTDSTVFLTMRPGVHIYGGFTGTETQRGERDWEAHALNISASTWAPMNTPIPRQPSPLT